MRIVNTPIRIQAMGMGMKELAELVRTAQGNMTGRKLAELSGIDASKVSKLRNGVLKETLSPEELAGLSRVLKIPQFQMLAVLGYDVGPSAPERLPKISKNKQEIRELVVELPEDDRLPGVASMFRDWIAADAASSLASSDTR